MDEKIEQLTKFLFELEQKEDELNQRLSKLEKKRFLKGEGMICQRIMTITSP